MIGFIDAHVHPPVAEFLDGPLHRYRDGLQSYLGRDLLMQTPGDLADFYRSRNARAVVFGWDTEFVTNRRPLRNADIAGIVASAPDVFFGFGAADPTRGAAAVTQVHEAARQGLVGLAFHPSAQGIGPGDRYSAPVWEAAADHDLICHFETGFTSLGAGQPGGSGIRLEPGRPVHVDAVAAEYPEMRIVIGHAGPVWLDEAIAVALHKRNVWLDLSGQHPRDMDPRLLDAVRGPLADRCVFGSRYPFGTPDDWLTAWHDADVPEHINAAVRVHNAAALLGLEGGA